MINQQPRLSKELEEELLKVNNTIEKIDLIINFCRSHYNTIHNLCSHYAKIGIKLSNKINYKEAPSVLNLYISFNLWHDNKQKKAETRIKKSLPALLKNKHYADYGLAIIMLSQMEWAKGNIENAFDVIQNGFVDLRNKWHTNSAKGRLNWGLAVFYFDLGDLDKSYYNYKLSQKRIEENSDYSLKNYTKVGIASIYKQQKKYKKAAKLFMEALLSSQEHLIWMIEARSYYELGHIKVLEKGDINEAYQLVEESYQIRKKNNAKPSLVSSLILLAEIQYKLGDYALAESKLKEALVIANEKGLKPKKSRIFLLLSRIYEHQNKLANAIEFYKKYHESEEEVNSIEKNNRNKYLKLKLKEKKAKKDIDLQRKLNNKLKKFNRVIIQQKNSISSKNEEKATLLKEIHHRVKNNLQIITSLLSLQSQSIKEEKIKELFNTSQHRINSMALIHEMLYQSNDLSKINYHEYLEQLINSLVSSFMGNTHDIKIKIEVPDIYLSVDTAIPLGLLINEIITNSLKYGLYSDKATEIYLKIKMVNSTQYLLEIGDNGPGYPKGLNYRQLKSLGLRLIYSLAKQIRGEIIKDNEKLGTHYILKFEDI